MKAHRQVNIKLTIVASLLQLPSVLTAQDIKIWPDSIATRQMKRAKVSAYIAAQNNNSHAAAIICPGGSYYYLGIEHEGHEVAKWLQTNGISSFVLKYRVGMHGNRHPAMIQDLQRTIQLVREKCTQYQIDPHKIGVIGFSAGGHLAGMAATYYTTNFMESLGIYSQIPLRPDFVAMIYPVVSMTDSIGHSKSRRNLLGKRYSPSLKKIMSLEQNVHKGMPPIFLIHCQHDKTVDSRNAYYYCKALEEKGVNCNFTLYDEKGHGFGINPKSGNGEAFSWNTKFLSWLKTIHVIPGETERIVSPR
ncbi:MAG: alpha/beta hydrolase [Dysgonamonadaceae bacterium]|jgi:acetyl esterase/lipase|nr:alpha/beta hydrolase [Dysgonamonadaceae bacterium]